MKSTALREFFSEVLKARGAKTAEQGKHLLEVKVPSALTDRLGDEQLRLAFSSRGLQEAPEAELATAGNPIFDRVLELALESGASGQRFLPLPSARNGQAAKIANLDPRDADPALREMEFGKPRPVYSPVIFHVFRVRYSLEDVPDDLEVIPIDAVSLEALAQHPDLPDYWDSLEQSPADSREVVAAFPLTDQVLQAALQTLEHRLRKRLHRIRRASRQHLEREAENIRSYYQQLIEETKKDGRRGGGKESREQKIHLLQLDWASPDRGGSVLLEAPRRRFPGRGGRRATATIGLPRPGGRGPDKKEATQTGPRRVLRPREWGVAGCLLALGYDAPQLIPYRLDFRPRLTVGTARRSWRTRTDENPNRVSTGMACGNSHRSWCSPDSRGTASGQGRGRPNPGEVRRAGRGRDLRPA